LLYIALRVAFWIMVLTIPLVMLIETAVKAAFGSATPSFFDAPFKGIPAFFSLGLVVLLISMLLTLALASVYLRIARSHRIFAIVALALSAILLLIILLIVVGQSLW
jgi:hypothetical protein